MCRTPKERSRPIKKYRSLLMKNSRHDGLAAIFHLPPNEIFFRKWPSHGGGPVLTVLLLCVAVWTHTLASERAHTTKDYGKDERRTGHERDNENE